MRSHPKLRIQLRFLLGISLVALASGPNHAFARQTIPISLEALVESADRIVYGTFEQIENAEDPIQPLLSIQTQYGDAVMTFRVRVRDSRPPLESDVIRITGIAEQPQYEIGQQLICLLPNSAWSTDHFLFLNDQMIIAASSRGDRQPRMSLFTTPPDSSERLPPDDAWDKTLEIWESIDERREPVEYLSIEGLQSASEPLPQPLPFAPGRWNLPFNKFAIRPDDPRLREQIDQLPIDRVLDVIWIKFPDPAHLPSLRELAATGNERKFLPEALAACGDEAAAHQLTRGILEQSMTVSGDTATGRQPRHQLQALRFAARSGDRSFVPLIEALASDSEASRVEQALIAARRSQDEEDLRRMKRKARDAQDQALLALTALGEPTAPLWRERFDETQYGAGPRITAALALYYLGDPTGREWVEALASGTERSIPTIYHHVITHGSTGELHDAVLMLRSDRMDGLALRRLASRPELDPFDDLFNLDFFDRYESEIIPSLLQSTKSRDGTIRMASICILAELLQLDAQPDQRPSWEQLEVIAQLYRRAAKLYPGAVAAASTPPSR